MSVRFSIVIPAYGCADLLAQCLDALRRADFSDFECVVVDDGSPVPLQDVAAARGVRCLRLEARGGPARARNRGVALTHGEILVFLDADVRANSQTLRRFDEHFRARPQVDAVMGSYDSVPSDPAFVSQFKNLFHHYIHQHSSLEASTFWTGCGAVRRAAFDAVGGFDEAQLAIEDIEIGLRLRAHGYRIHLDPAIQVTHLKRWTLSSMVRVDLFVRAVPWLLLMLRERSMPADLNVTLSHRLSVALVWGSLVLAAAVAFTGSAAAALLTLAMLATLLFLNRDLYRFFARERGALFAVRSVPLHWLYYAYCGLAVWIALGVHWCQRRSQRFPRLTAPGP